MITTPILFPSMLSCAALMARVCNWAMTVITQVRSRRRIGADTAGLTYRMPVFPAANCLAPAILALLVVLMGFSPNYRIALLVGPLWALALYVAYRVKVARTGVPTGDTLTRR